MMRLFLFLAIGYLADAGAFRAKKYTVRDDFSWAITRDDQLADPYHQKLYDDFMEQCNEATKGGCQFGEDYRLRMNRDQPGGVYNYTTRGFEKIKAPKALFDLINNFWQRNRGNETIEWKSVNPYHNMWEAPPYFVSLEDNRFGGGEVLQREVWREARKVLEEWTGMRLSPVSMYGVRIYKNNSILAPHVDRMPLVTSCIINIEQDVDEDWPLEVFDHEGNAYNVTMEPGDMVLYESHSIIHGRPFPMRGRAYVNVFLHFEPIGPLDDIAKAGPQENGLPPYVIPGGSWEEEALKNGPWSVHTAVPAALRRGDMRALEYIAMHTPEKLIEKDYNGWAPVHEAVWRGDVEGVQFLLENGASIEDRVGKPGEPPGYDLLELFREALVYNENHPMLQFLLDQQVQSEL